MLLQCSLAVVYGLLATLGSFELKQAMTDHFLREFFIGCFIVNCIYSLLMIRAAYVSILFQHPFHISKALLVYGITKIILVSIAVNTLYNSHSVPEPIVTLCIVEMVLLFGPIAILLILAAFGSLLYVTFTIVDEEEADIVPNGCLLLCGMWLGILLLMILGICDIVQATKEESLRTLFILLAISNILLPTLCIVSAMILKDTEHKDLASSFMFFTKTVLASIALHVLVNTVISTQAMTLCLMEVIPVFGSILALAIRNIVKFHRSYNNQ
jgi:hypothetical protein